MDQGAEFGPYLILDRLGSGGMGVVYRATDRRVPRTVALKILNPSLGSDPQYRERFRRESAVLSAAEHPHIVPMYGAGEIDDRLYLDMRYIDGLDLQSWLSSRGPVEPRRAAAMIEGLADALDFVHSRGILHRDIKPSNIVLAGARAFPYLLDFGIARAEDEAGLTQTHTVVGSLEYMAPERFEGQPADRRTDIYALTGVLLAALTGRPPYPGCSEVLRAVRAHCFDPVPVPSALDPALAPLDEVIAHGMAKDPTDRFDTAEHLAEAAVSALERVGARRPAAPAPAAPAPLAVPPAVTPPPAPTVTPPPAPTVTTPPPPTATPAPAPTLAAQATTDFGPATLSGPLPPARTPVPGPPPSFPAPGGPPPPAPNRPVSAERVPPALAVFLALGAAAFAVLLAASVLAPQVSEGPFHHAYASDTRGKIAGFAVPAVLALAAVLFTLARDRVFDFAAGLTIAAAMYVPAYLLDLTRHVHFSSYPAGPGYKFAIAALVVGLLVAVVALWSPGRHALRGRARWWPVIVAIAAAGLAANLAAFHNADVIRGVTEWQLDPWAIGFMPLTAGTVVAALYILGGRRIALGMLTALAVYSPVQDLILISYPGTQLFPKLLLASDVVVIAAGFAGWFSMRRRRA